MRISSNLTLFYKFFLPVFWIVFFGAVTVSIWSLPVFFKGLSPMTIRIIATLFYLSGILFFYWATLRLHRIEMDDQYIYISNYFKNYRYPHQDVAKIVRKKRSIFPTAKIHLKNKGSLGSHISFIPASALFDDFFRNHPNLSFPIEG